MKQLCLFIFTMIFFLSTKSQQLPGNSNFNNYFANRTPGHSFHVPESNIENQAKWKLLFKTTKGKVYESPIDKMHCIAFNFKSKMPVVGSTLNLKNLSDTRSLSMPNPMLNDMSIPAPLNTPGLETITK